jgi:hypothetical protein
VPVRAYVVTTGIVFGLLVLAHLWRVVAESPALAREPFFVGVTLAAAGLCLWAMLLLRRRAPG